MKKLYKVLLFFMVLISANNAHAQLRLLQIDSATLLRDTLEYGDSVQFVYRIKNISDSNLNYNDSIITWLKTSINPKPLQLDRRSVFIPNGQTVLISTRFSVTSPYFANNQRAIIVVWPTGTGNVAFNPGFDSIEQEILVQPNVSVAEQKTMLNYVRFYPNPAHDIIYFDIIKPEVKIRRITLRDMQGRKIESYSTDLGNNYVDLKQQKTGIYLLEVEYSNNKTGMYRIIKTQ